MVMLHLPEPSCALARPDCIPGSCSCTGLLPIQREKCGLETTCVLLLGFLLPPGQPRSVFWRQLSLLHGLCRRLGSRGRSLAAFYDSRRGLFLVCHFLSFCQVSEPPLNFILLARSGGSGLSKALAAPVGR